MMTDKEVMAIAATVLETQSRAVNDATLPTWREVIGDLPYPLAREAARLAVRETEGFITPATIRRRALELGRTRLAAITDPPTPPSALTREEYATWQAGWKVAAMQGAPPAALAAEGLAAIGRNPQDMPALDHRAPTGRAASPVRTVQQVQDAPLEGEIVQEDDPAQQGGGKTGRQMPPTFF